MWCPLGEYKLVILPSTGQPVSIAITTATGTGCPYASSHTKL